MSRWPFCAAKYTSVCVGEKGGGGGVNEWGGGGGYSVWLHDRSKNTGINPDSKIHLILICMDYGFECPCVNTTMLLQF